VNDSIEVRLGGHSKNSFDCFGINIMALVQPVVESNENVASPRRSVRIAFDLNPISAGGNVDRKTVLDRDQMTIIVTEQGPKKIWLLELDFEPGGLGNCSQVASRHQAATF
jgi:hypothetical protein